MVFLTYKPNIFIFTELKETPSLECDVKNARTFLQKDHPDLIENEGITTARSISFNPQEISQISNVKTPESIFLTREKTCASVSVLKILKTRI